MIHVVSPLVVIIPICIVILFYIYTKHRERLKIIEQNLTPYDKIGMIEHQKLSNLKNGVLFLALGLGLLFGHILIETVHILDGFMTYITMLLIFGGIGFLINYRIIRNWKQ